MDDATLTTGLEALIAERAACLARVLAIDAILARVGMRPALPPRGAGRRETLRQGILRVAQRAYPGEVNVSTLTQELTASTGSIRTVLTTLTTGGEIERVGVGRYRHKP